MKKLAIALALAVAALAAPATAQIYDHNTHLPATDHSMLASSTPIDGALLDTAPQTLVLTFRHAVTLQTLSLTDAHGAAVAVSWTREPHRRTYSISMPALADGAYRITFTATALGEADRMPGEIGFTIR